MNPSQINFSYPAIKSFNKVATKLFINLSKSLSKSIKDTSERIAEKRVDLAPGLSAAPQIDVSIKEVVDEIIADGVVTYEEQRDPDRLIFDDHQISAEEQKELDRLNQMNKMNYKLAAQFYYNIVCMLSDRLEEANSLLFK